MLPQLNTGKMSWCGGLSCATVLARDWSRVARSLQPAFRRQQSNSTLLLVALLPTDEQNCHRFSSYGSAHPSMSARRGDKRVVSVFLLSLVSYTPLAALGFELDPQLIAAAAGTGEACEMRHLSWPVAVMRQRSTYQHRITAPGIAAPPPTRRALPPRRAAASSALPAKQPARSSRSS